MIDHTVDDQLDHFVDVLQGFLAGMPHVEACESSSSRVEPRRKILRRHRIPSAAPHGAIDEFLKSLQPLPSPFLVN